MYPVNSIGPMAATGVTGGTTVSAAGSLAIFSDNWVVTLLMFALMLTAAFAVLGAVGASLRILPVPWFAYREPESKSPTFDDLLRRATTVSANSRYSRRRR